MKCFLILFAFLLIKYETTYSQVFIKNNCDSRVLSKSEYLKCTNDTLYESSIIKVVDYIIYYKTVLHPKYRIQRKQINLPKNLSFDLNNLREIYDSTLYYKLRFISKDMNRNQLYVQPNAYISSILNLENFKLYPDVYAILLNDIHLSLAPKTTRSQLQEFKDIIEKIYSSIEPELRQKVEVISSNMQSEKRAYNKQHFPEIFQGAISDTERKKYDLINFLLWNE